MFIPLCMLFLVHIVNEPIARTDAPEPMSLSSRSVLLEGNGTKGPYKLPDLFILRHSEIVYKDTIVLRADEDYYLNTRNGTVLFFESLRSGDTLVIRYRFFPYPIQSDYKTREISPFLQGKPMIKEPEPEGGTQTEFGESGIVVGGAKTFSIGTNTAQGFTFDQSLKVNITGEISEGLSISGVLSDENTPLEPQGSTQSLEELDRVYVTIKGREIGATLGDFNLDYRTISTPIIQRELLGITGNLQKGAGRLNVAYGIPRGKFHSQYFKGSEGKQGPYQLSSREGEEDIVIVAGTETIFLDGILLKRGENNDYTIDYHLAQVTFTSKQVITDESDIVAEFQYTRLGFKRSVYATQASFEKENVTVGGFYVRDSDEINQTEGFNLTEEKRNFLASLGDDTTGSWMDGGTYVGTGKGDYNLVDSFYVYQGYHQGAWEVLFTYVGESNGDYQYNDSISAFQFVGDSTGDYASKIRVSLPENEQLAGLQLGYSMRERLQLSGEVLGSDYDRNVLSTINDADNRGHFTKLKGNVSLLKSSWGAVNVLGDYYYRNEDFKPVSRIEPEDFEERWNIGKRHGKEELRNGTVSYRRENFMQLTANLSSLKRQHTDALLREGRMAFTPKGLPHINALSRLVSIRGDTSLTSVRRSGTDISHTIWRFIPRLHADQEIRTDIDRRRWRESGSQLGLRIFSRSLVTVGYSKRSDDIFNTPNGEYDLESNTTSKSLSFETEEFSTIKSSLSIIKRNRLYESSFPGENTELLLIESTNRFIPIARKLEIETNYAVTGKQSVLFKERYYEVEENTGDYSRDSTSGNFFPDTLGNYKRTAERIGEGNPVTALRAHIHLRSSPFPFIRGTLTASVLEENKGSEKFPIYSLQLRRFLDDSLTEQGKQTLDASISWYPHEQTTLSYVPHFSTSLNNRLISSARRDYTDRHEFRIEQRLTDRSKLSLEYIRTRTIDERVSLGLEKREQKERYAPSYAHFVLQNLEFRLKAITGTVKIEEPLYYGNLGLMTIKSEGMVPACTYTLRNNAIVDASFSLVRNRTPTDEMDLPYDVRSFYPIGITTEWKARATIAISKMVSMNIIYNGLNRPDRKTLHSANAELRADF